MKTRGQGRKSTPRTEALRIPPLDFTLSSLEAIYSASRQEVRQLFSILHFIYLVSLFPLFKLCVELSLSFPITHQILSQLNVIHLQANHEYLQLSSSNELF